MNTTTDNHIPVPDTEKEVSSLRLVLTLVAAGFCSGLLLVSTYLLTKPLIEKNRALALEAAILRVIPGCASFKTIGLKDNRLQFLKSGEELEQKVFAGYDSNGNFLGFALPGAEFGFQDLVSAIFGLDPQKGMIVGFEVLESKETPGLGDKIIKDERFLSNFHALSVNEGIKSAKPGEKEHNNEVETITGATISSMAVIRLIQKTLDFWLPKLQEFHADGMTNRSK
jgi:electron transport complex protein RnfG